MDRRNRKKYISIHTGIDRYNVTAEIGNTIYFATHRKYLLYGNTVIAYI